MQIDYLVVGSGLTGSTIARNLKDSGRDVLVVDRRSHLGGNVHDHFHPSGIRVHTYGPHYFRTAFKNATNSMALEKSFKFLQDRDREAAINNALFWWKNLTRVEKILNILSCVISWKKWRILYLVIKNDQNHKDYT